MKSEIPKPLTKGTGTKLKIAQCLFPIRPCSLSWWLNMSYASSRRAGYCRECTTHFGASVTSKIYRRVGRRIGSKTMGCHESKCHNFAEYDSYNNPGSVCDDHVRSCTVRRFPHPYWGKRGTPNGRRKLPLHTMLLVFLVIVTDTLVPTLQTVSIASR